MSKESSYRPLLYCSRMCLHQVGIPSRISLYQCRSLAATQGAYRVTMQYLRVVLVQGHFALAFTSHHPFLRFLLRLLHWLHESMYLKRIDYFKAGSKIDKDKISTFIENQSIEHDILPIERRIHFIEVQILDFAFWLHIDPEVKVVKDSINTFVGTSTRSIHSSCRRFNEDILADITLATS